MNLEAEFDPLKVPHLVLATMFLNVVEDVLCYVSAGKRILSSLSKL